MWIPVLAGLPVAPRQRVLTPIQEQQAFLQAEDWLSRGIAEATNSAIYVNNLVLAPKANGTLRLCIDCSPANAVTEELDWALPRLQDLRHFIRGAKRFSRIDLLEAFFRIMIPVQYRHLTAFRIRGKTYQMRRMPFGLKTAPAHFQRFMDWGLCEFTEWAMWYMDDILIKAEGAVQLEEREGAVRRRLHQMGSTVNEGKSESNKAALRFAGLWVMGTGVGPDTRKLKELLALPSPRTKAEAQSALGLVSYLRDFIPLVSHFTAMLYPDKNGLRLEPNEYEKQWGQLRAHVAQACTINHHWKEGEPADAYTDASLRGLAVVIIQSGRIVALASRKLSAPETRYSATDREQLGLVYAAQKLRIILHRSDTVRVWTDHSALLTRRKEGILPRQARWGEIINTWLPTLTHVKGKCNPADYFSRWGLSTMGAAVQA